MRKSLSLLILFVFYLIPVTLLANVALPSIFSDNMVLQQKSNAGFWGTANAEKTVTIYPSWTGKNFVAKADAKGNWKIKIPTPAYGGPYTVKITSGNTIILNNVMIGEVWLCSGQSNMEMPLAGWGKINNYQEEIDKANYSGIRLLQAIHTSTNQPVEDLKVRNRGWDVCSPATVDEFSATAYFFAREIYQKTKIPIGLIHSSWGGTIAEAWTSYETLKTLPDFAAAAKRIKQSSASISTDEFDKQVAAWEKSLWAYDKGYHDKNPVWAAVDIATNDWKSMSLPGAWETKGLSEFDGAIWFRKIIVLTENDIQSDLIISLGAIDDQDETYANGTKIGSTSVWNKDRFYTIPKQLLRKGENVIAVRVFDSGGGGGFWGNENSMYILLPDENKINIAGNWFYKIAYSLKDLPPRPVDPNSPNRPAVLYNAMINPIINYTIRGAIWYQGESNASRAYQYRKLLPAMIKDWRTKFGIGDFPFYIVQLANFMKQNAEPGPSAWAELREAQLMTTNLNNTGMATTIDIGDADDIHPKNKQDVGRRLALIALNKIYNKGNEFSGPLYQSHKTIDNKIIITFSHAKGLAAIGSGIIKGFSIAGTDKKFYWADAQISGNTIIVQSSKVLHPVAVRYGWANNPDVNLINSDNLSASPFRTDDWKESTYGVK